MKIVLIRHGRPDEDDAVRQHDPPLRADGWRQARAVAALLAGEGGLRVLDAHKIGVVSINESGHHGWPEQVSA